MHKTTFKLKTLKILKKVFYILYLGVVLELTSRCLFSIPLFYQHYLINWQTDSTWRRNWVLHRKENIEITYTFDIYSPTKGWTTKPNIRNLTVFNQKILNTNSRGFRGTAEYSRENSLEKTRIITLGDSFTFGDEVSDDETYPSILQQILPSIEIINTAVHGYGHDQMLISFKDEGRFYNPDVVILGFVAADMERNMRQFGDYAKPRFAVKDGGKLDLFGSPVPTPEKTLKQEIFKSKFFDFFQIMLQRLKALTGFEKAEKEAVSRAILEEMISSISDVGAVPVVVYLPIGREITDTAPLTSGEEFLFAFCQTEKRARCFSTRPYFLEEQVKGRRYKLTGHWDVIGHSTVAKAIMCNLTRMKLINGLENFEGC